MAGIAQVLSDCRSDTEDVLALRLTDAMLMCNPNATSALLRKYTSNPPPLSLWVDFDRLLVAPGHGLLRAVQELTPPPPEDDGEEEEEEEDDDEHELSESDDDDPPPPPPDDSEDEAVGPGPAAALADGQVDPEQEVPPPPADAPAAEEMDSPPSPHAGGEAGWVVNCVTDEPTGSVMPFRQSCIYAFEDCVDGELQRGMAVVAPHPGYGPEKLWSAEVMEAGIDDTGSSMVQLRYAADEDEATQLTSECSIVATEPTAEAPGTGTEVLVLFRDNDDGPEYRRMRVTDEMPEPGHERGFAEGMPGEDEEIDPRLRTPPAFGDEDDRAELDELLYSQQVIEERLRASGLEQAFLDAAGGGGGLGGLGEILGHLQGDQDADYDLRDMLERDIQFGSVGSIADMARRVLSKLQAAEW